jgi:hypothetical protein
VHGDVFGIIHNNEIFGPIVELVPVDVMGNFGLGEFPTEMRLQNGSMFQNMFVIYKEPTISFRSDVSCALIGRRALMTTEFVGIVFPFVVFSAMQAGNLDDRFSLSSRHASSLNPGVMHDTHTTDIGRTGAFINTAFNANPNRIFPFAIMCRTKPMSVNDLETVGSSAYISHKFHDNATGKANQG